MRIYVASSWRNEIQPTVVEALREEGHLVYDFRNPASHDTGFHWSEIDTDWQRWDAGTFRRYLADPIAERGFSLDKDALDWAQGGVLVLPCGRSAHLEAGYLIGQGKPVWILLSDGEPELMYKLATDLCLGVEELLAMIKEGR